MLVKHLLYTEKYTIEGARQKVDEHRKGGELKPWRAARSTCRRSSRSSTSSRSCSRLLERRVADARRERDTTRRDAIVMRFLCTNDDGILAHGLECLVRAAEPLGEVTVVAPDREQSATSHSLTLHHPLRPVQRGERRWQVDGTPTDCVMLAIEALMPRAARLRAQRHQSRPEHGRGRAVLGHRRRGDGRPRARHSVDRDLVRRRRPARRRAMLDEQVQVLTPLLEHLTSLADVSRRTRCST